MIKVDNKAPNDSSFATFRAWFVPTAVGVMTPCVAYLVGAVVTNNREIAVIHSNVRAHAELEAHRGSIPRLEIQARLDAIVERLKRIEAAVK